MGTPARKRRRSLLGFRRGDLSGIGESLAALAISAVSAVVAGVTLAKSSETIEALPGLVVLIPAAIALRGNVFGALGSRLSTAIHTGTFTLTRRADTVTGQNIVASLVLSLVSSLILAVLAKAVAVVLGRGQSMPLTGFIVISVVGGVLASVLVLAITLALVNGSVRYGWDLDNLTAPLVTATGDVVTVPALFLAASLVTQERLPNLSTVLAVVLTAVSVALGAWVMRTELGTLRRITIESVPILAFAALLSCIAGVAIHNRFEAFGRYGVLLVLLPGYLGTAGALGGIMSSRLSSRIHLGVIAATRVPQSPALREARLLFILAVPTFFLNALVSYGGAIATGLTHPNVARLAGAVMVGGVLATAFVAVVAYYGTLFAVRLGLDPDSHGIPFVTSSLDLVGAFTLVVGIALFGIL